MGSKLAHKLIPGTSFAVDCFRHIPKGVDTFFLSHGHSDHYAGITENWAGYSIYCSDITARFLVHSLGVNPTWVHAVALDTPSLISGVEVTLIDANHCPGAIQFLFRLQDGRRFVHCGDMRYAPHLKKNSHLQAFIGADAVFLDTTYCNKRHTFPPQEESVGYIVHTLKALLESHVKRVHAEEPSSSSQPCKSSFVALISTYVLGKERILKAVAEATGLRLFIDPAKLQLLKLLQIPDLDVDSIFTTDASETPIHIMPWGTIGETWPYFRPNWRFLEEYRDRAKVDEVIGFVPTGWTYEMSRWTFPRRQKGAATIHLVPYSEHSSWDELLEYVAFLKPHQVIPTVGVDGDDGEASMRKIQAKFSHLLDETKGKERFLAPFAKKARLLGDSASETALGKDCSGAGALLGDNDPEASKQDQPQDQDVDNDPMRVSNDAATPSDFQPTRASKEEEEFLAVVGQKVPLVTVRALLRAADGNLERAVTGYYDGMMRERLTNKAGRIASSEVKKPKPDQSAAIITTRKISGKAQSTKSGAAHRRGTQGASVPQQRRLTSLWGRLKSPAGDAAGSVESQMEISLTHDEVIDDKRPLVEQRANEKPKDFVGDNSPDINKTQQDFVDFIPSPIMGLVEEAIPGLNQVIPTTTPSTAAMPIDKKEGGVLCQLDRSPDSYDPIKLAGWSAGSPVPYLHLAQAFECSESTRKRLRVGDILTNMFRSVLALTPQDLASTAFLAVGKVAPDYKGLELNVGGGTVAAAIREVSGVTRQRMGELYRQYGDIGDVAQACRSTQSVLVRPAALTVRSVHSTLLMLAAQRGTGAARRRQAAVLGLLRACRGCEARYIARTLVQALRVSAGWRSVVPALARAVLLHQTGSSSLPFPTKARQDAVGTAATAAFHVCPDLDVLVAALLAGPAEEVEKRLMLRAGVPIKPMLAKIGQGVADSVSQLKDKCRPAVAELKYDGVRAQIHIIDRNCVYVFSRNCEDRTASFPDVCELVKEAVNMDKLPAILDAEIVGVDRSDGNRIRPFQELTSRARVGVQAASVEVDVAVFAFDCLMIDGRSLLKEPLGNRRRELQDLVPGRMAGRVELARTFDVPSIQNDDQAIIEDELNAALVEAFSLSGEGLMLKSLTAPYEPSRRSDQWIKLKRDYCEGLHDTLDLVVIGAWYGNGRKVRWYSPFLLAVWDPRTEKLQSLCRCMTGFSDAFYQEATERLSKTIIPGPKAYYDTDEMPSVWFEPREVWEIRGADLTLSPVHRAAVGLCHPSRGLGLRFPRFLRVREDKQIEDASSSDQVAELYQAQVRKTEPATNKQPETILQQPSQGQGDGGSDVSTEEEEQEEGSLRRQKLPKGTTRQHPLDFDGGPGRDKMARSGVYVRGEEESP